MMHGQKDIKLNNRMLVYEYSTLWKLLFSLLVLLHFFVIKVKV